jgi:arylsulfatase A-like enzyme
MASRRRIAAACTAAWIVGGFLVPTAPHVAGAAQPPAPPNILLLISDDQAWSTFNRGLMPNVYADLVDQGILFNRAYVTSSLCCPSRSQIMTGLYEHHTGVDENNVALTRPTLPSALHDIGYRTLLAGKYLNSWPCTPRAEFDSWHCVSTPPSSYTMVDPWINDDGTWVHHTGYQTDLLASDVSDFIASTPDTQPFFGIFSPTSPHLPADDPRYTFPAPLPRGPSFNADMIDPSNPMYLRRLSESPAQQATNAEHFAAMSHAVRSLDDAMGSVLDALGDRADNTVVIYLSDNGYQYGEHGRAAKTDPYEEAVRVPMIVRYPPLLPTDHPTTTNALAENVDIAPTIADLLGIAWGADGVSLVPLISGSHHPVRDDALIERCRGNRFVLNPCNGATFQMGQTKVPAFEGVVTEDAVYIRYPLSEETQLFDLTSDPYELQNRAGDPALAGLEADMSARLDSLTAPPPVETTIVTGPTGSIDARVATFTYFSQSRFSTYECRLTRDRVPGPWHPCNGELDVEGSLVDGDYVFEVAGTDEFGSSDPSPASRAFSVQGSGPSVSIDTHPPEHQRSTQLSFGFSSPVSGATFECRLAKVGSTSTWSPCDPSTGASYTAGSDGLWNFEVRATDPSTLAVTDPPAARLVEVDNMGPLAELSARPPVVSSSSSATFGFFPSETALPRITCGLDGATPVVCSSGSYVASGLSDGPHTLSITFTDPLGNEDSTSVTWTVDTARPTASFVKTPARNSADSVPMFKLGSSEARYAFRCQMDTDPVLPCTTSTLYTALNDGPHTFTVFALDEAGNVSAPVSSTWTIDTTPPVVTITSGRRSGSVTTSTTATFKFTKDELGMFWCSLDGVPAATCTSPATYTGLSVGSHTFSVYARDRAGNVSASVSRSWTVVAP